MKTCIYLRKSRKDATDEPIEVTLRKHEEQLIKLASRLSLDIVEIKKEVVTGDSIKARPKMQELLEEVTDGMYGAVLVMDIDRLGRGDLKDQGTILDIFKLANVQIITPGKTYNLDDEFDEDQFDFAAFFARKELKMIKRRLMRGKQKSLEDGNYIASTAPYGYAKKDKTLIISEEEKPVIELIYSLYIDKGMGDGKIARYLNENGYKTRKGGTWDKTVIRGILLNPVYAGKIAWNKRKPLTSTGSGRRKNYKDIPFEDWEIYDGKHEPIIEWERLLDVVRISKERYTPHIHKNMPLRNPLAYLLKCGTCGHTMTIRTCKGKKPSLRCYKHCGGVKSGYMDIIEEEFVDQLIGMLTEFIANFSYEEKVENNQFEFDLLDKNEKELQNRIQKIHARKQKLFELVEDGTYSKELFLERSKQLQDELEECNIESENIKKTKLEIWQEIERKRKVIPRFQNALDILKGDYWDMSVIEKNELLRSCVSNATYNKKPDAKQFDFNIDISLKF